MTTLRRWNSSRRLAAIAIAALAAAAASAPAVTASRSQEHSHPAPAPAAEGASMMEKCQAMMARHEEMTEQRRAMDAKLDGLVAAMKSAAGDDKVPAIEAEVEELVAQRRAMHAMMADHHAGMMRHMMEHMSQAMPMGEGRAMMGMCPMMKGMAAGEGEEPAEGDDGHAEHHPQ